MDVPPGIWMLAFYTWRLWANDKERLWMNSWNMSISFGDRLTSKTISPSSKFGSNEGLSLRSCGVNIKRPGLPISCRRQDPIGSDRLFGEGWPLCRPKFDPDANKIPVAERLSLTST